MRINCEKNTSGLVQSVQKVRSEVLESDNVEVGGPGKMVEIDKNKFGKSKYHKGS